MEVTTRTLFNASVHQGYNDDVKRREWDRTQGIHRANAWAAFLALREPGEPMLEAAPDHWDTHPPPDETHPRARSLWLAIIDEAFKEG